MSKTSVLVLGGGGHAKVVLDCLKLNSNISVIGIIEININLINQTLYGIPVIAEDALTFENFHPSQVKLVNGLGSVEHVKNRQATFLKFKTAGYDFINVVHPTAYIANDVSLGEGVQIMAGSIIQAGSHLGDNVIVNTKASIDHDCCIESHVHVAPGVVCCGDVTIKMGSHVGSGAVIVQGVTIGQYCLIAAGAVTINSVNDGCRVAGVPAKNME